MRLTLYGILFAVGRSAWANLDDPLDAHPPRWSLAESDCEATVVRHVHGRDGFDGGGCETITMRVGHGSRAVLAYPVEPLVPLDDLVARVRVRGVRGATIGLRLRFPYVRRRDGDGDAVRVVIEGASADDASRWSDIGIGSIESRVRQATAHVRSQFPNADVDDVMVDAVTINAYDGHGRSTLSIDDLRIRGMVPMASVDAGRDDPAVAASVGRAVTSSVGRAATGSVGRAGREGGRSVVDDAADRATPFPAGRVTRLIQYRGEPLVWLRSLGIDGVWLDRPPDADLLRDAARSGLRVYCPAPPSPDPSLTPLLGVVGGWVVDAEAAFSGDVARQRGLPRSMSKPLLTLAPERHADAAAHVDAVIDPTPPPYRGLSSGESLAMLRRHRREVGRSAGFAVAIPIDAPEVVAAMNRSLASAAGAAAGPAAAWQRTWATAARALSVAPRAILWTTARPLSSPSPTGSPLSALPTTLSFINRSVASIERWTGGVPGAASGSVLAGASRGSGGPAAGITLTPSDRDATPYRIDEVGRRRGVRLYALTADVDDVCPAACFLAGDGDAWSIGLPPETTAWRLTRFAAEPLRPAGDNAATTGADRTDVDIVSPDFVEWIAVSPRIDSGGRLAAALAPFGDAAAADRWTAARVLLNQTRTDHRLATALGWVGRGGGPIDNAGLLDAAGRALGNGRGGSPAADVTAMVASAARCDAWVMRTRHQLMTRLVGNDPRTSDPSRLVGDLATLATRRSVVIDPSSMSPGVRRSALPNGRRRTSTDRTQGDPVRNRLSGGDLDRPEVLAPSRWSFGNRLRHRFDSFIAHTTDRPYAGGGALRLVASPRDDIDGRSAFDVTPGGYGGTVLQVVSPSVLFRRDTPFTVRAMVKTLGLGGAHQGVLIYDSVGGPEAGVLVRGADDWTLVELRRITLDESPVQVHFELIGAGEAVIDEVAVVEGVGNRILTHGRFR